MMAKSSELSAAKQALLEKWLQGEDLEATKPTSIPRRTGDGPVPVSFAQQRLWFLDQFEHNSAYNIPVNARLLGKLDVNALERSLNEIVSRHEVLRTTFALIQEQPVQVIAPTLHIPLPVIDLRTLPDDEKQRRIRELANAEDARLFDLSTGPLLRTHLLHVAEEEHVFLMTVHHIVFDGWSVGLFLRELATLYGAFATGKLSPLPELPIQYADFTLWQREWLQGDALEQQLSYWKQQLCGELPVLVLPTDRPRPAKQTFHGTTQIFTLSQTLTAQLKALCQEKNVTLFMLLLAALDTLFSRYSCQEDIIVGSPIANRNRDEIEDLIGFFVNTLALRVDLSGNPTFLELLSRTQQIALDAYARQDVPFEQLVETLQPERNLSHPPIFQVMFALQNVPRAKLELPGLTIVPLEIESATAKFDLLLEMDEYEDKLTGALEYNTDLFDAETITRLIGHFQTLLEGIVANPTQKIAALPLLPHAEREQILVAWNDTRREYVWRSLPQMFETQAAKTPDMIAVQFQEQKLTYRELNRRANQLAHHLRALGIGPDACVVISLDRSIEMVVGVLGILKTGAAYVPLDPNYPEERLAFMLEDSKTPVLLTQQSFAAKFPEFQRPIFCLDTDWETITQNSVENPNVATSPENLAYVIYTSGSTGKPKGVAMRQGALVNLIQWQLENTTVLEDTKTLQFASLSFDVSFQEIFSTWCAGGTLLLITEDLRRDTHALLRFLQAEQITRLFLPFVALQQIAEVATTSELFPTSLREVITAGEQLQSTPPITKFFQTLNSCRFYNHYGPSESHVVTAYTLPKAVGEWAALPPIGTPVANTQIYLLDQLLQPVPIGIHGDLYIGGECLARGYLDRPDLTTEKFVPDPFSKKPGARLYKTGDLARYLPDGNIEFLGRADHQLKIRGFRIELGEIETVLAEHPLVKEVVVMAHDDPAGGKQLVGYIVPDQTYQESGDAETAPLVPSLRRFLQKKFPEYMIPSVFMTLDKMPLTPSGKIARRLLPAPEGLRPELEQEYVAPRTEIETTIAKIWSEILVVERVGVNDNFFDLGGHSLRAVKVNSRIGDAFNIELPLSALFEAPTVAGLAERVEITLEQGVQPAITPEIPEVEEWEEGEI